MFAPILAVAAAGAATLSTVRAQTPPSTFPKVYPGQPSGDYSTEWQSYFQVNDSLPNVTFALTRSFAGNIAVNRADHPNDTLFFWGFEKENGSLTAEDSTDPWVIWLQGGPGSSSMAGLILENGPIRLQDDLSLKKNDLSWATLADMIWVDNPVGVGFSTADSTGYVLDDDQMGTDFIQFLTNLVKVFPALATRPLIIAGESYGGHWIPYLTKAIFSTSNPPINLTKIAIGNGIMSSFETAQDVPVVSLLETYPQIVSYDTDVLDYFREQTHLCGFDLNFSYPETNGPFAALSYPEPSDSLSPYNTTTGSFAKQKMLNAFSTFNLETLDKVVKREHSKDLLKREAAREVKRQEWKRDLSLRSNGTIDSWYACFLLSELYDYMVNFTIPYDLDPTGAVIDVYDLTDGLVDKPTTSPGGTLNPEFFQDSRTVAALHAPDSLEWEESISYPFNNSYTLGDISPDPMDFFTELATNASKNGVAVILYSGNDDSLLPHRGTEAVIQNTTFGGIQGFSKQPSTPWTDDSGNFAGIVHQERNWTYVLVKNASHLVPQKNPSAAYTFFREFVLGSNQTGFYDGSGSVVGGEDSSLKADFLPGNSGIFGGSISTTTTYTYPSATVDAWNAVVSSIASEQAIENAQENAAVILTSSIGHIVSATLATLSMFLIL